MQYKNLSSACCIIISDKFSLRQQRLPKVHGPFHGRPLPGNRFAFAGFSVPGAEQRPKQIQDPNTRSRNIHSKKIEFQNDYTPED